MLVRARFALTALAALAAALSGCERRFDYTPLNAPPRPPTPRSGSEVQMFTTALPERPYVEVGILETTQESAYSTDQPGDVMASFRDVAGQRGCDGLVMVGSNSQFITPGRFGTRPSDKFKGYRATCIVYRAASPP